MAASTAPSTVRVVEAVMGSNLSVDMKVHVVRTVTSTSSKMVDALKQGGVLSEDGTQVVFSREGVLHRTNGPAVVNKDGSTVFKVYGIEVWNTMSDAKWEEVRDNLLAKGGKLTAGEKETVTFTNEKGEFHRIEGPAVVRRGEVYHYTNGVLRKEMYAASSVDHMATKRYYTNGELHGLDGPAVMYLDGRMEYYKAGKCVHKTPSYAEWETIIDDAVKTEGAVVYGVPGGDDWCYSVGDRIVYRTGRVDYRLGGHPEGRPHRLDGPALIVPWSTASYWIDGKEIWSDRVMFKCDCKYHINPERMDNYYAGTEPGVVFKNGVKFYFKYGVFMRSNAPSFITQKALKIYTPPTTC